MKPVVTAKQMAAMDAFSINTLQIPGVVLMENAGRGIAETALRILGNPQNKHVTIYCGPGNNGGDGYVVARHLANVDVVVETVVLAPREKIKGDALINLEIIEKMGLSVNFVDNCPDVPQTDLIVDALLGTGVIGPLRGLYAELVERINQSKIPVLAVDIPTGVNADTGAVSDPAIKAHTTTTMACLKPGLLFSPGRKYAGKVEIVDISMPRMVLQEKEISAQFIQESDIREMLPKRNQDAFKNSCGTVATVAGSEGFTGAAALVSEACLRAGTGLSYLAIPQKINSIIEAKCTEVITWPFDDVDQGYLHYNSFPELEQLIAKQAVVAIGPGLGRHEETGKLVHQLLSTLDKPLVLDADGLNFCKENIELIKNYKNEAVLTPHPGELARLLGISTKEIGEDKIATAKSGAKQLNKVLVLKGGPTVIADPAGNIYINSTGNAGMATAGSGDVLTGLIAGLMAQGLTALNAAIVGVYIHGLAGDLARKAKGEMGMIATDILNFVPKALMILEKEADETD